MRDLKFRGIRCAEDDPKNGEVIYGDIIQGNEFCGIVTGVSGPYGNILIGVVDPKTVGQFIGILDKNGTDIYEDDIVEWQSTFNGTGVPTPPKQGIITWSNQKSCFFISYQMNGKNYYKDLDATSGGDEYRINYIEVIGNIHEPQQ